MNDILDILRDWHADATKKNSDEAFFIKQIIDEISSLRYQSQNPGLSLTIADWEKIDKVAAYATHKKLCAYIYGRCNCGFNTAYEEFLITRNPPQSPKSETE
jgi:hypothetical protein